jgi:protein-tyrosine phosphatase
MYRYFIAFVIGFVIIYTYRAWCDDCQQMSEVAHGLYVSNWNAATDEALLRRRGITRVICINQKDKTPEDLKKYQRLGIDHHQYYLPDRPGAPIGLILNQTFRLIDEEIRRGGRVLVHCRAGISRSVTVAAAYIMQKNHISSTKAIEQIRCARPVAWPNRGFRLTLQQRDCADAA